MSLLKSNPTSNETYAVVFVGGAYRFELLRLFHETAANLGMEIDFFSVENDVGGRSPVADLAQIIHTELGFDDPEFVEFLRNLNGLTHTHILMVPLMDSASRAVAGLLSEKSSRVRGVAAPDAEVVSDKIALKRRLDILGILNPLWLQMNSVLEKNSRGFGSNHVVHHVANGDPFGEEVFFEQYIPGPEFSLDVYYGLRGEIFGIARERIATIGGEVRHTRTQDLDPYQVDLVHQLGQRFALAGPVNIQVKGEDSQLIEINPRFGGGAPVSIHAGWNAPYWIFKEYFVGLSLANELFEPRHVESLRSLREHIRPASKGKKR